MGVFEIDLRLILMRDVLNNFCNDVQDILLTSNDVDLVKILDPVYIRLSYAYQRLNNYIIIKEDK